MSRPPLLRASFDALDGELVVDSFAGGGGASTGIEAAIGRPVDIAINHSAEAIAVHRANHPEARHYTCDVWEVDPREACGTRPVGLLWASPACTHFSRAKGSTNPRSAKVRSLAWVVVRWAKTVRPRIIFLENVEEFSTWGPLDAEGRPNPARAGRTFRQWIGTLRGLGYTVEWRSLTAADYGAPTTRRRLFLVARRDGQPIVWPEPTHGRGRAPWRSAAEVIDWTIPCPSIFGRARPLADATLRRIAAGVRRYVLEAPAPFLVPTAGRLAAHALVQTGYGEREGQAPRTLDLARPLGTVVAGGQKHALVAAFLSKHYGGVVGHEVTRPLGTVTTQDHHALSLAFLTKFYGTSVGSDVRAPVPTVTTGGGRGGGHLAAVRAFLVKYYGASGRAESQQSLFEPLHTVTTKSRFGLVEVHGEPYEIADIGMRMLSPRELFAAQGFPEHYEIEPEHEGRRLSKTAQIALAGNSVCPDVAAAVVAANVRGGEQARRSA